MGKTARAVVTGSRLFNTAFGLPRNAKNTRHHKGTLQSGSPPGHATIVHPGTEDRRLAYFWATTASR
jgi:hypothetical protein